MQPGQTTAQDAVFRVEPAGLRTNPPPAISAFFQKYACCAAEAEALATVVA